MQARIAPILGTLFITFVLAAHSAGAAPQILGLLATKVPQPLVCSGSECSADLASFCLQPRRGEPWPGTSYHAANDDKLELVVLTADHRIRILKARSHVRFRSNIAMTAVRAYVDREFLDSIGARKVSIQVSAGAVLLPAATKGDPDPITADEIAAATGPDRLTGAAFFEDGGPVGTTARLTAALLSATPPSGKMSPAERSRLWTEAIGSDLIHASTPEGIGAARAHLDTCYGALDAGFHSSMRSCLEYQHESLMRQQNELLRQALKSGW